MKTITLKNIALTLVLAVVLSLLMPWWAIMIAGLVAAIVFPTSRRAVFFAPFIAVFLFWIAYAFLLTNTNDFTMSKKIATLFQLGDNWPIVLLLTGIVGGVAAGIAGVFGRQLQILVKGNP